MNFGVLYVQNIGNRSTNVNTQNCGTFNITCQWILYVQWLFYKKRESSYILCFYIFWFEFLFWYYYLCGNLEIDHYSIIMGKLNSSSIESFSQCFTYSFFTLWLAQKWRKISHLGTFTRVSYEFLIHLRLTKTSLSTVFKIIAKKCKWLTYPSCLQSRKIQVYELMHKTTTATAKTTTTSEKQQQQQQKQQQQQQQQRVYFWHLEIWHLGSSVLDKNLFMIHGNSFLLPELFTFFRYLQYTKIHIFNLLIASEHKPLIPIDIIWILNLSNVWFKRSLVYQGRVLNWTKHNYEAP